MTAFVAAAYNDRVELLTDGAVVRDDGTVAFTTQKVWTSDTIPMAFAGRGNYGACMLIGLMLQGLATCGTFDGTVEAFKQHLAQRLPRLRGSGMDGIVAGLSETDGPVLLYFTTSNTIEGCEPFALYNAGPMHGEGSQPSAEVLAEYGFPERAAGETLAECGADLLEAMRRAPMRHVNKGGHEIFGIGGHADLTVIDAAGARTTRLRTWPQDVVGKKIEPMRAARHRPIATFSYDGWMTIEEVALL